MKIIRILKKVFSINKSTTKTLVDIAIAITKFHKPEEFSFLEIGVFKADNAVHLINALTFTKLKLNYIGFDLFDDIDYLKNTYPEDYSQYNLKEYPYWEFASGEHSYINVSKKISRYLEPKNFELVAGDTTKTLPEYFKSNTKIIDLIYIDGCHDYEIVKSDFANCELHFKQNPNLVIAFDDYSYPGVKAVYDEISLNPAYSLQLFNANQFIVTTKSANFLI